MERREIVPSDSNDQIAYYEIPQPAAPRMPELVGRQRIVAIVVLACIALLSYFAIGQLATSPEFHGSTISALDEKKDTVMKLVAGSSGTSTAITLLPGDAGTPIAEKLVDLSSDFLVVIAAIYLEKYLLTIIGFITFRVIIPVCCVLLCFALLIRGHDQTRIMLTNLVARVTLLSLALYCVVPASVFVSGMIEQTYEASLNETLEGAQEMANAIEKNAEKEAEKQTTDEQQPGLLETIQNLPNAIQQLPEEISELVEQARIALNSFIEALAVMIVTSCIIPILVLVFFLWLVRLLLGVSIDVPMSFLQPRSFRRGHRIPRGKK